MEKYIQRGEEFVRALTSGEPTSGSGGAMSLVAAIGMALCDMAAASPSIKEEYEKHPGDIAQLRKQARELGSVFLSLMEREAAIFHRLRKENAGKDAGEDGCAPLDEYCIVHLELMRRCCDAIDLHAKFAAKGLAVSLPDVSVGVLCCRAALQAASLIVHSTAAKFHDRKRAMDYNEQANHMISYIARADEIYVAALSYYP